MSALRGLALTLSVLLLAGCAGREPGVGDVADYRASGLASYYGARHHGKRTASGEAFDRHALTAAHRSLPFGSQVRVTRVDDGRSVVVRINDRGPYSGKRLIDLSEGAARQLGMLRDGVVRVRVEGLR